MTTQRPPVGADDGRMLEGISRVDEGGQGAGEVTKTVEERLADVGGIARPDGF